MRLVKTPNSDYGVIIPDGTGGELKLKVRMLNYDSTFRMTNGAYTHEFWYADSLIYIKF